MAANLIDANMSGTTPKLPAPLPSPTAFSGVGHAAISTSFRVQANSDW